MTNISENLKQKREYVKTGIDGFDKLFKNGIPKGSTVIMAGGTGCGKTNFCLQIIANLAAEGKNCYYMGFEESEQKIIEHMEDFGWNPQKLIQSNNLKIKRFLTSEIYYYDKKDDSEIKAMMTKEVDPLLMELEPLAIDEDVGFKPDIIVLDSLTAVSSTFSGKDQSYRFYVERLFRFFEKTGSTNFLITETKQMPEIYSSMGIEEFLADGVIVFYNIRRKNVRETAIEVLKMRGESHKKKVVSLEITDKGVKVFPDKEVSGIM